MLEWLDSDANISFLVDRAVLMPLCIEFGASFALTRVLVFWAALPFLSLCGLSVSGSSFSATLDLTDFRLQAQAFLDFGWKFVYRRLDLMFVLSNFGLNFGYLGIYADLGLITGWMEFSSHLG